MPDNALFDIEKLSLTDFKLITGQINTPESFNSEHIVGHHTNSTYNTGFDVAQKLAKADIQIEIKTESKGANQEEATGNFHFTYIFEINNLEELATAQETGLLSLNPHLAHALAGITYSTSRGVLLTRLQGTVLQEYFLPIISTNRLILDQ